MERPPELPSRRMFLALGASCPAALIASKLQPTGIADQQPQLDPVSELIRLEVKLAVWVRENSKYILDAPLSENRQNWLWVDYGFRWPAFTLAHLFVTQHPANPLFQKDWCAELALSLVDKEVAFWHYDRKLGRRISTGETPHYVAAYVLEKLSDQINEVRRQYWIEHEEAWVSQALRRPLGITGGYHDSWRMTALYRLGKVLGHPDWCEMGVFLFKRLLRLQTEEGFWEDGRHHGPSARYCGLMLPSLAWMYRWTEDPAFGKAAERLVDFMSTYVYPDGVTVGSFDGRNSNCLAYFPICPGFELTAQGRSYSARAFQLWKEMGMLEDITKSAQSTRDLARLAFYSADTCCYLGQYDLKPDKVLGGATLPIDHDGVLENHSTEFDGVMIREGPWVAAISGQNSDLQGIFRLERESRIELWHEKSKLLVGGGHHRYDWRIPHANAILDTGYSGSTDFGAPAGEDLDRVPRIYYKPRVATSRVKDGGCELVLDFGHGVVTLRVHFPTPQLAAIEASWTVRQLERLCLQLPLVLWQGSLLEFDGIEIKAFDWKLRPVNQSVRVKTPFGDGFLLRVPKDVSARVHAPIRTGVFHRGAEKHRRIDPIVNPYDVLMVSCQWLKPERRGGTRFIFEV